MAIVIKLYLRVVRFGWMYGWFECMDSRIAFYSYERKNNSIE